MDATPEMKTKSLDLSILVPFFNEEENLSENYQNIKAVLDDLKQSSEIVYVDDGSTDRGFSILKEIATKDPRVRVISFSKNFGQTAAMEAAFKQARGRIFITLDADNQNDPRDIPALLDKMKEGFGVVSGWRKKRKDGFFLRRLPSMMANWLISRVTGVHLRDYGCTLKAYDAYYIEHFNLYGEMHRFIPAYAKFAGATIAEIPVNHRARTKGKSKYGIMRTFKVLLDLITVKFLGDFATKPIYFFGGLGFLLVLTSVVLAGIVFYYKYFLHVFVHRNPLFLIALFAFLTGLVLIMLGLLAEMLMRTYHESQDKKPYRIRETAGF